ncbi:hypothetical protein GCM10022202_14600 [Microbacterium marinilacus]|uniref:DUF3558 domain-containing protein n=2 Tax=Microbacterium marinilacus TaxID=415209 RepID=A0ABP7BD41_9MICO
MTRAAPRVYVTRDAGRATVTGMTARLAAVAGAALLLAVSLAGCAAEEPADTTTPSHFTPSASPGDASATPTADPVDLPTDCREILSDDVLAQLSDVPLNDAAFGESGPQDDGSLVCVWGDPGADTTNLATTIERMSRGPALALLNELMDDEDFSCWDADGGTRCEKTWENETYPVTDGRTLFWRQDVLIDTRYSNLAPEGYTASIVAALFD